MCILLILSTLIFNEILVINICGLAKNTKLFLEYEAENENSINEDNEDVEIMKIILILEYKKMNLMKIHEIIMAYRFNKYYFLKNKISIIY